MLKVEKEEMLIASQPGAFIPGVGLLSTKTSARREGWIIMILSRTIKVNYIVLQ